MSASSSLKKHLFRYHSDLSGEIEIEDLCSYLQGEHDQPGCSITEGLRLLFSEKTEDTDPRQLVCMILASDALSMQVTTRRLLRKLLNKVKGMSSHQIAEILNLSAKGVSSDEEIAEYGWLVLSDSRIAARTAQGSSLGVEGLPDA